MYLLVDRRAKAWALYSDPHDLGYGVVVGPESFGTPVDLPEPFGLTLNTSEF
ncbi:hypothetical protein BJY24_001571 [Nocardia transvalensis]|uniref:Restriction endonuclease n=1 Tax=Nocardia transvalensis TaxID=37333 RepID=A0A7W9PBP5_9NOCA|nr:hypothetical protein [Nocardia transvalensis]MBB5912704.1 hypothetical protein [Nocardia transvalensis]